VKKSLLLFIGTLIFFTAKPLSFFLPSKLLLDSISFSRIVYDRRGVVLRITTSSDDKFRVWTPLDKISPNLINLTLQKEDKFFYYHPGVQPTSLIRAFLKNLIYGTSQGASTITMQVARLRFNLKTRTIWGKLTQCLIALGLESVFSKEQILEAYLNLAPYGSNIEGIGAASLLLFGKHPKDLTELESRILTLLPQSPSKRNLLSARGRQEMINLIERQFPGFDSKKAKALVVEVSKRRKPFLAPHFTSLVLKKTNEHNIKTTLELRYQSLLQDIVQNFVAKNRSHGIENAAVLLADRLTLSVLGYIGSANFWDVSISGQVDGITALRSPGSTLKPFIYALAMERGFIHPKSVLFDGPILEASYNPSNFDKTYSGAISVDQALIRSKNVPAIFVLKMLGLDSFFNFLTSMNFRLDLKRNPGLSIAIGGAETNLQKLIELYGVLANDGLYRPLKFLLNHTNNGKNSGLSREVAFLMTQILQANVPPRTVPTANFFSRYFPVAWKSGTSNGLRDAWAVGYFGQFILGVWVGRFKNSPNSFYVGRDMAGSLFFEIVDALAPKVQPETKKPINHKIKVIEVCSYSGNIATQDCPHKTKTWVIPGKTVLKPCHQHQAKTEQFTALKLSSEDFDKKSVESDNFRKNFWFEKVGGRGNLAFILEGTLSSSPLFIISPSANLNYVLPDQAEIPLFASNLGGSKIFWYVNNSFVGVQLGWHPIFWKAYPGYHQIVAIDQFQNFASVNILVKPAATILGLSLVAR